jgi:hypothetical protein
VVKPSQTQKNPRIQTLTYTENSRIQTLTQEQGYRQGPRLKEKVQIRVERVTAQGEKGPELNWRDHGSTGLQ